MNGAAYETYDLVLATYLVAGEVCRLKDIKSSDNGRKLFCFDPAPSKKQLIEFYAGTAQISARRFAEVFATLKGAGYTLKEFA